MKRSIDLGALSVGARSAVLAYLDEGQAAYDRFVVTLEVRAAVAAADALLAIKSGATVRGRGEQRDGARFSGARHFRL